MSTECRVYIADTRFSDFKPRARVDKSEQVWFSPDGDLDIVLTAEQWNQAIDLIKATIAKHAAGAVNA